MMGSRIDRFAVWFASWALLMCATGHAETLRMATASVPENWGNPYGSTSNTRLPLQSAVFDPLTRVSAEGVLMPWLVEKWERTGPTTLVLALYTHGGARMRATLEGILGLDPFAAGWQVTKTGVVMEDTDIPGNESAWLDGCPIGAPSDTIDAQGAE